MHGRLVSMLNLLHDGFDNEKKASENLFYSMCALKYVLGPNGWIDEQHKGNGKMEKSHCVIRYLLS